MKEVIAQSISCLECSNCGLELDCGCDDCSIEFDDEDKIFCDSGIDHICENCKEKRDGE